MLEGNTLFAGDSITVGLPPFVQVNGLKRSIAEGGRTSDWLVQHVKGTDLRSAKNMVVLIGTNDIGHLPASSTLKNTLAIWDHAKSQGIRVFGQTIPPFGGHPLYMPNFSVIEGRRKTINEGLKKAFAEGRADGLIDLSTLMADPADPTRLGKPFYGGGEDHVHPRKDAHGKLLTQALSGSATLPPLPAPGGPASPGSILVPPPQATESSSAGILLLLVGVGGLAYLLTRKRTGGLGWR